MRKSSIFILLLLGLLFLFTPTESDQNPGTFESWRPSTTAIGCHPGTTSNEQVDGSILFNSSWLVVTKGQEFSLSSTVVNFAADIADSGDDVTIGFNILDENNSDFMSATIEDNIHTLDENGTSITPWEAPFTAPDTTGNYTLVAYAVAGGIQGFGYNSDYFYWVRGQVRIEVKEPTTPQGVGFSLDHGGVIDDKITFTVTISNLTDVKTIELSVDNGLYQTITLQNSQFYELEVSNLSPGTHNVTVLITNQADLITKEFIEFDIPEPVVTTTPIDTTTSEPFTQSTETKTEDHGLLSSPVSLGILVVVMLISVSAPLILMRKFFAQ